MLKCYDNSNAKGFYDELVFIVGGREGVFLVDFISPTVIAANTHLLVINIHGVKVSFGNLIRMFVLDDVIHRTWPGTDIEWPNPFNLEANAFSIGECRPAHIGFITGLLWDYIFMLELGYPLAVNPDGRAGLAVPVIFPRPASIPLHRIQALTTAICIPIRGS